MCLKLFEKVNQIVPLQSPMTNVCLEWALDLTSSVITTPDITTLGTTTALLAKFSSINHSFLEVKIHFINGTVRRGQKDDIANASELIWYLNLHRCRSRKVALCTLLGPQQRSNDE